jgi:uncharacterized protein YaaR (DUF327 family)
LKATAERNLCRVQMDKKENLLLIWERKQIKKEGYREVISKPFRNITIYKKIIKEIAWKKSIE